MNKIKFFGLALVASAAVVTSSCSDYVEVKVVDQMTMVEVVAKRATSRY